MERGRQKGDENKSNPYFVSYTKINSNGSKCLEKMHKRKSFVTLGQATISTILIKSTIPQQKKIDKLDFIKIKTSDL